ncbi:MAG: flavin-nucleotide-binding protein [Rhodospirillales bacterium]|jgi:PPOX class probable FMN-dependent enzyme|uniref:pyridoxamine 5'-phosphate oxidase family protein n=1 Tax=Hwanghaeella sp. 1Z406 TaxID=3402811 RepID=UPI000C8DBC18|nr:flavin-nucleotide-binding protein [Rhodospirillales bacterium]|tara:strand:+ start:9955 stop:10578 length:624 start_codon:yes stop_codon:yes gene_type:complete
MTASDHTLSTVEDLEALYGVPKETSLIKEIDYISDHYRAFIEASPFVVLSTVGPEGLDSSPRGDPAGFVHITDSRTVLIPDRRGNNRIDSLRNIVRDPRVSLLFLIPGIGETLRINGRATISVDPDLLDRFIMQGKPPRSVLQVQVDRVYFQCQKALARSQLWNPDTRLDRNALPSAGQILSTLSKGTFDGKTYDNDYPERMKQEIY